MLVGGVEKLPATGLVAGDLGVPALVGGANPCAALEAALDDLAPDEVIDLSDAPVLDARARMALAARALARGIPYCGADFTFRPAPRPRLLRKPSLAVIGTGKRTGKTAVACAAARVLADAAYRPVIVTMGRGGPEEPEILDPATTDITPELLVGLASAGRHAASDHIEDALVARVPAIGTRRCGGGLGGAPVLSTFERGVAIANERPEAFVVLEGSGTAIPPVHADATVCVVPAAADAELALGYLGAVAFLLSDAIVVTLSARLLDPGTGESVRSTSAHSGSPLEDSIRSMLPGVSVVHTTFRPRPLEPVSGSSVFFATTAPAPVAADMARHLEEVHGADIIGWTNKLAERSALLAALSSKRAAAAEVVVTELKAGAVDVVTRVALERGSRVVYCANDVVAEGGPQAFSDQIIQLADLARDRFAGTVGSQR